MIDSTITIKLELSIEELKSFEKALGEFSDKKMQEISQNIVSSIPMPNITEELHKVQITSEISRFLWKKFGILLVMEGKTNEEKR